MLDYGGCLLARVEEAREAIRAFEAPKRNWPPEDLVLVSAANHPTIADPRRLDAVSVADRHGAPFGKGGISVRKFATIRLKDL